MTTRRFPDPYEGMSDDELDRHFSGLLASHRERQQAISIRFPEELLTTLRQVADELGIGYQTLIKSLLEKDVERLRARPPRPRQPASAHAAARGAAPHSIDTPTRPPGTRRTTPNKRATRRKVGV